MIRRILALVALGGLFLVAGPPAAAAPLPAGARDPGAPAATGADPGAPVARNTFGAPSSSDSAADEQPMSPAGVAELLDSFSRRPGADKIYGKLKALAAQGGAASGRPYVSVMVESTKALDLSRFADRVHTFTWPAGEHVAILKVKTDHLLALASLPGVYAVSSEEKVDADAPPSLTQTSTPSRVQVDKTALRAEARSAGPWRPESPSVGSRTVVADSASIGAVSASTNGSMTPDGWWDVRKGHSAMDAWNLGYKGKGVNVAVLDFSVDFAHPDLQGSWAVHPEGHPYAGWPQVFDTFAGSAVAQDQLLKPEDIGQRSTRNATSGLIELYQTSGLTMTSAVTSTACFRPIDLVPISGTIFAAPQLMPVTCDFVVPKTSKSGVLRYGHHPDQILAANGARNGLPGEFAGVLGVDEKEAGQYDTIYVDIDGDRDFTDEKPMTKASPLGWRDVSDPPDGVADLTAGLLYWISDGARSMPGGWVYGLDKIVPGNGEWVGILTTVGDHGTLCASNVASRGRLGVRPDVSLEFRDLPGDHRPTAVNPGMAPEASLVSVGEIYLGGRALFEPGWRYAVFGTTKDRHDDDIQVTSNSYGFSDEDADGWDNDSRLIDYYVRKYSPETTFLISSGNGGPGYGTRTAPVPSVAIDVAASSQMGSTGANSVPLWGSGSITDTSQIIYGDVYTFSGRGPRAGGGNGPDVAADGAFAAGGFPINFVGNGTLALQTWGGTSRSAPVAAGTTALIYQAFKDKNGRWPRYDEARSILMSGSRYAAFDVLSMGAGVVDAADSVRIAAGKHGVSVLPSELDFDTYTGGKHNAFANVMRPGDQAESSITIKNPTDKPITVKLSAQQQRKVGTYNQTLVTDRLKESTLGSVPDYLIPIDKTKIPAGTELLVARGTMENNEEFELPVTSGGLGTMNYFQLGILQHTDINKDGKLWTDANGNGVVDHRDLRPVALDVTWDGGSRDPDAVEGAITKKLDLQGVKGDVAILGFGCNRDGKPPTPEQDVKEKVALVERGECTFVEKLQNAKALGAVAVIVFTTITQTVPVAMAAPAGVDPGELPPGVMINRADGLLIKEQLLAGKAVIAHMRATGLVPTGIDADTPANFEKSEIQRYEYEPMNFEYSPTNNWTVHVHHPLERWADGLYLAWWHLLPSPNVTNTHISVNLDSYKYQPWTAVTLGQTEVTIPAGKEVKVPVSFKVAPNTAPGMQYGAVFLDYDRSPDDPAVPTPGGYEMANLRTTVPINVHVLADYRWKGTVTLGGSKAYDDGQLYNNGAVNGNQDWGWRPESGDWRYFFVDASEPPPGTYWIYRTQWEDATPLVPDIDTRVYAPQTDRFTDPASKANTPEENAFDADWYGPYGLGLLVRSPYLHRGGGYFSYNTSTGANDDWLAAPATKAGLHEVMLHNVRFSGQDVNMGFTTDVSSLQITPGVVSLIGDQCQPMAIRSQMDLPDVKLKGYGMSIPESYKNYPIAQEDPNNVATSAFRRSITLTQEAARFKITADGQDDDDIDLFLLKDANKDGVFAYPAEVVSMSNGPTAHELIDLSGFTQPGDFQIWIHGWSIKGEGSTINVSIDVISGNSLTVKNAPAEIREGELYNIEVCVDQASMAGKNGPANGIVIFGPGPTPTLFRLPVTWQRNRPAIYVPFTAQGLDWTPPSP